MKYIRTMTQQKLSFWLALYIGWFMNVAVFFRRFDGYAQEFTVWKGLSGVVELVATVFVTFFLLRLLSLFGRRIWRILATLIVLFSAAASYYMTFLNVVIGYGIIASVMTTDIDLSKEVIGWHLILWLVAVVVASDVLGYFAGRMLGGAKFWPAISPKKTWSGTVAGWIGAALVGLVVVLATGASWALVPVSALVAFAGQMGDIAESWVKRRAGVKDASNLIPGHGGALDRFDALIGAVVVVMALRLVLPVTGLFGG